LPWADCTRGRVDREFDRHPIRTPEIEKRFDALMAYGAAYDMRTNGILRTGYQRLLDAFSRVELKFESRDEVDWFLGGFAAPTS
jgi:hypothetical protein